MMSVSSELDEEAQAVDETRILGRVMGEARALGKTDEAADTDAIAAEGKTSWEARALGDIVEEANADVGAAGICSFKW